MSAQRWVNMTIFLESAANEKVKHAVKTATSSKYRKKCSEFFLEGLRLCFEAVKSDCKINSVFFTESVAEKENAMLEEIIDKAEQSYCISQAVCNKLSQTQNSQGVFCLCSFEKKEAPTLVEGKKYIALENVQNPDNLGAISRTAEALGIAGLVISSGCDVGNPKALRASMGSLLRLDIIKTQNLFEFCEPLESAGWKLYATSPDSNCMSITKADFSGSVMCIIGNEANGISNEVFSLCKKITIPMNGRAESFNAAAAAAVTMWEMVRQEK